MNEARESITGADRTAPASAESTPTAEAGGWRRLARRLGVDLRAGEGGVAVLLFVAFFLFITFQYATKSIRQSTFIDELGAAQLPWVYLAVAVFSYPVLAVYSRLVDRLHRSHLVAATCGFIAATMVLFWWLYGIGGRWVPVVFYVWVSIAYVMNVSQFWSFANHALDARQARRLFGFIGAGGLLGGVAGGQVARIVSRFFSTRSTFFVAAAILALAAGVVVLVSRFESGADPTAGEKGGSSGLGKLDQARGGLRLLRESNHLRNIAVIVVLTVVVAQIVDLQFNWAVEQSTSGLDDRTAFFGNFYTVMGIAAFVFQLVFTGRIHRALGVGVALKVLPATMGVGTLALLAAAGFVPGLLLAAALILKVGENGIRYSLDQATRELLFLPVPSRPRLKAKAFIDVFAYRASKGLAALLLLPVTFGLMTAVDAAWATLALIAVWLVAAGITYRGYVRSFRHGLEERTLDAELPINLADAATLELVVESLGSTDSRQVLHGLDLLAAHGKERLVPPLLLYHDDPEVRRRTLELLGRIERRDVIPLIERRLADDHPEVRAETIRVLSELKGEEIGSLMLPRLKEGDPAVRAAAVAALSRHGDPTMRELATAALQEMLGDGDADVRCEAAKAIGTVSEPRFQDELVRLLYDADPRVSKEAIAAVRQRVRRDGYIPLYAPILVAMLGDRRRKQEARDALAVFGDRTLPVLEHFMSDPEESLWVRRGLPKTVARLDSAAATEVVLAGLDDVDDAFMRRKLIEALGGLRGHLAPGSGLAERARRTIVSAVRAEAGRYLQSLAEVSALGVAPDGRLEGPCVRWHPDAAPGVLSRLLADRLLEHLDNLFGLLGLLYPPDAIVAAHRSLTAADAGLRNKALEYLDNVVEGELHEHLLSVVGDEPLPEKLRRAADRYGVERGDATAVVERHLDDAEAEPLDGDGAMFAVAAMYTVSVERMRSLYPRLEALTELGGHPWLAETAEWVVARIDARSGS